MQRCLQLHLRRKTKVERYSPRECWEKVTPTRFGSHRRVVRMWDATDFDVGQAEQATNWVRTGYARMHTWYKDDGHSYQDALAVRLDAERAIDLALFQYPPTYAVQRFACVDDEPGSIVAVWLLSEPRPKPSSDACAQTLARELGGNVTTVIPVGGAIGSLPKVESYPYNAPASFHFRFVEATGRPYRSIYIKPRYMFDHSGPLVMEAVESR